MRKEFEVYAKELQEWNKKFNLTAITDPEEIRIKHFEDSLSVLKAVDLTDQGVVDVGAGAGFPGIPLKITRPGISLTLIEATRKKVDFLNHIIKELSLKDVAAVWGRAEDLTGRFGGKFDVAVSRAVAKLDVLSRYCLPLLKPGGIFIAMKGPEISQEVESAQGSIKGLGARVKEIKCLTLPGTDIKRSLIIIEKK